MRALNTQLSYFLRDILSDPRWRTNSNHGYGQLSRLSLASSREPQLNHLSAARDVLEQLLSEDHSRALSTYYGTRGKELLDALTLATLHDDLPSYDRKKAAHAVAFLVRKSTDQGSISSFFKISQLLYFADRKSIHKYGLPILDEVRKAFNSGPANETTAAHLRHGLSADIEGLWSRWITMDAQRCIQLSSPDISVSDLDELSDADCLCLEEVWEDFGPLSQEELMEKSREPHCVPEWSDPGLGEPREIPISSIYEAVGVPFAEDTLNSFRSIHSSHMALQCPYPDDH